MSEATVTIVKIRGKGAGIESLTEMPYNTYLAQMKEADKGTSKDILEWKAIKFNNCTDPRLDKYHYQKPEIIKTPEQILEETYAKLGLNNEEPNGEIYKAELESDTTEELIIESKKRGRPAKK